MPLLIDSGLHGHLRAALQRLRERPDAAGVQQFVRETLRATWRGGYVTEEFLSKKTRDVASMLEQVAVKEEFFQVTLAKLVSEILGSLDSFELPQLASQQAKTVSVSVADCRIALGLALLCIPLSVEPGKYLLRETTFCDAFKYSQKQVSKLECVIRYLNRTFNDSEAVDGRPDIQVTRLVETEFHGSEWWLSNAARLTPFTVREEGGIEEAHDCLQADFANRYVGGGVLSLGCVQEEIRFIIAPELIAASFACLEPMDDNEAVIISNTVQFLQYSGYSSSFRCEGDVLDLAITNSDVVVCIDAIPFRSSNPKFPDYSIQYSHLAVLRELNKVLVGIKAQNDAVTGEPLQPLATGNWGCGVFNGDPQLKAVIQWIAASVAGRAVIYYPFADPRVAKLTEFVAELEQRKVTCAELYNFLLTIENNSCPRGLFAAILANFTP